MNLSSFSGYAKCLPYELNNTDRRCDDKGKVNNQGIRTLADGVVLNRLSLSAGQTAGLTLLASTDP